jgi:hypothetical protein
MGSYSKVPGRREVPGGCSQRTGASRKEWVGWRCGAALAGSLLHDSSDNTFAVYPERLVAMVVTRDYSKRGLIKML